MILTDGTDRVTRQQASSLAAAIDATGMAMACGPAYQSGDTERVVAAGYELGLDGDDPLLIPLLAGEAMRRKWATAITNAVRPSGGVFGVRADLLAAMVPEAGPIESSLVHELRRRGPWAVVWAAAHEHVEDPVAAPIEAAFSRRDDGTDEVCQVEPPVPGSPGTPCPPPAALWVGGHLNSHQAGLDRHRLKPVVSIRHAATDWAVAERWGDHHFATAMSDAFAGVGIGARVVPRHAWSHPFAARDLVVTLRGLAPVRPVVGRTNVLWVISHPTDLRPGEFDGYDLVGVASEIDQPRVAALTDLPIVTLLQAAEKTHFREPGAGDGSVLFIGNSRGVRRRAVDWAIQRGIPLNIYGQGWDHLDERGVVFHGPVDRATAADMFNSASVVLGDHWDDMRELGYVSNRVFDVAAAGGLLISDHVEGIGRILPGTVTFQSPGELDELVREWMDTDPSRRVAHISSVQAEVRENHTYDQRVRELLEGVREHVPDGNRLVDSIAHA